jgi:sigma-B regulation protein RsbU (phosphoserine phosphatase)
MRSVALVAAALLILRFAPGLGRLFGDHLLGRTLRVLTFVMAAVTIVYYVFRGIAWFWRRLMWRVRRRLAVTYLFIGLTPIILLGLLGLISAFGLSAEAMARLVAVQLETINVQELAVARTLVAEAARWPRPGDPGAVRAWVDDRQRVLGASLPGVRIELLQGNPAPPSDQAPPLPAWLADKPEWGGLVLEAPEAGEAGAVRSFSARALVRGTAGGRPAAVLLDVPLDDALAGVLGQASGMTLKPHRVSPDEVRESLEDAEASARDAEVGRPVAAVGPGLPYVVMGDAVDWSTGKTEQRTVFTFTWSWAGAIRQLLGSSIAGRIWRQGLLIVGLVFLGLELLALVVAAWMTRAVTGTVHELHRATAYIDRGDFTHRVRVRSQDQLGDLSRSFNDMAAHVESLLQGRVAHERLQREVEIAAQVQSRLFPRQVPMMRNAEIVGECRAARGVAGDYYDFLEIAPGLIALALGDVAGKGLYASLLMSNLQASLRAQAALSSGNGHDAVARLTSTINEQLCRSIDSNRFATLFLALYDDSTRILRYTNAGHNAAILVRADGAVERLATGGVMVGAFQGSRYAQAQTALPPGSVLLVFSDGLSEAHDAQGEEYGEDRLLDFALRNRACSAEALRRAVFEEIDRWSSGQDREDDQTLVIVRALQASGPASSLPA